MSTTLGLDPLLVALREAGLPVGVSEVARLRQVFALGPQIKNPEDRRLKAILHAVLVKSAEDGARFEPIFDAWLGRAGQEVRLREAPILSPSPELEPGPPPKRSVWPWVAVAILVVAILVPLGLALFRRPPAVRPKPAPVASTPPSATRATFWVPTLSVTPGQLVWQGWPAITLGSLALLGVGALWLSLRQRSWLPEPAPEPTGKGPPRVFLTPPDLSGPQLLEVREQEALVWGIGRFVADEPTHRLDLPATVRATARDAGIPHLLFHQARHPREVWLWVDEGADDPAIPRLADEIEEALKAHNLPVERSLFRSVPDWLIGSAGQSFAPNEVDERRDAALVAILTDGRLLARQYAADDRRVKLDALLRSLSHWPRLAFVDFAAEPGGDLTAILKKHLLLRITPPELVTFLGSDETAKERAPLTATGNAVWAAACALAPTSVDEMQAFQLRRRLGLNTSPWALREMRAKAPGPPGRLQWQPQDRSRLVNWLRQAEAQPEHGIAPESMLRKALDFWEEVYDRELKERGHGKAGDPWLDTPAHQHLLMEHALLGLWREATKAIRDLYLLHGGGLRELVERHLSQMAPLDWAGPEHLLLPWSWAERSGAEQVMLGAMKLGGDMPAATLQRPGRLFLGLSLCLGLAAGAITAAALSGLRPGGPPRVVHGPGKPADAFEEITKTSAGHWRVAVETSRARTAQEVPAGSLVEVRWKGKSLPCRNGEQLEEGGMTFVHVCPSTFMMGLTVNGRQVQVTLGEFWIGRTKLSATVASSLGEAKRLCESHGWRLPTRAELEYVQMNPWGISDMTSDAVEWVEPDALAELLLERVSRARPNLKKADTQREMSDQEIAELLAIIGERVAGTRGFRCARSAPSPALSLQD